MARPDGLPDRCDSLLPEVGDSPPEIARKRAEFSRQMASAPDHPAKFNLVVFHAWAALAAIVATADYAEARAAFSQAVTTVRDPEQVPAEAATLIAHATEQFARLCAEHDDLSQTEKAFDLLAPLSARFRDNPTVVRATATTGQIAATLCGALGDEATVARAERFANALIGLPRLPDAADREACADNLVGTLAVLVHGFLRNDCWGRARVLVWQARRLLLSPSARAALCRARDRSYADQMHDLFCALMQGYLQHARPGERGDFGTIEESYDFATTKRVTCWEGIAFSAPARWTARATENGRWVVDEDEAKTESGTLWVDYDVLGYAVGLPVPGSEAFDETLGRAYRGATIEGDKAPVESAVHHAGGRRLYYMRSFALEGDEWLDIRAWRFAELQRGHLVLIHFNLVILAFLAGRDDFKALVPQIEAAIGAAEIDWARLERRRTGP